ncbi:Bro-N domain-containing protein, partial [Helicobacter typhlonius]
MQLQVFNHKTLGQVRVVGDNENPLFCLRDICEVLEHTNPSRVLEAINAEFGDGLTLSYPIKDNLGRTQQTTFITEPQLYFILMRSDKPKAKPFRQWVVNEVLPSIRKQGYYLTPNVESTLIAELRDSNLSK